MTTAQMENYQPSTIEPVFHNNKVIAFLVNGKTLIPLVDLKLSIASSGFTETYKEVLVLLLQKIESGSMTTYSNNSSPYAER